MYKILSSQGYFLSVRGLVRVKGKGDMQTFFLDAMPTGASLEDMQTYDWPVLYVNVYSASGLVTDFYCEMIVWDFY